MAKLISFGMASLNGYITDNRGDFGWAAPDEEVHQVVNDLIRPAGTHLYGRRNYETMMVWETEPSFAEESPSMRDFAEIWENVDKIVYSTTLSEVPTKRTKLERTFDPESVRKLIASSERDLIIAGPTLASHAFRAELIDEVHVIIAPIVVPAGK